MSEPMTDKQIDAMKPGRELNVAVWRAIHGSVGTCYRFSQEAAAMIMIIEWMREKGFSCILFNLDGQHMVQFSKQANVKTETGRANVSYVGTALADTLPEAAAKAALKAWGAEKGIFMELDKAIRVPVDDVRGPIETLPVAVHVSLCNAAQAQEEAVRELNSTIQALTETGVADSPQLPAVPDLAPVPAIIAAAEMVAKNTLEIHRACHTLAAIFLVAYPGGSRPCAAEGVAQRVAP